MKINNFITSAIERYQFILFLVALMWVIEIINIVFGRSLNNFSIYPRRLETIYGIVTMHFLHWNLMHIISNTLPILVLGLFVSSLGKIKQVSIVIMLLSGTLVWIFARNGIHAGASALVMGYWGYLVSYSVFEKSIKTILISVTTIAVYGGMLLNLFDFRESISFEGHIFGLTAGVLSAWIWHKKQ